MMTNTRTHRSELCLTGRLAILAIVTCISGLKAAAQCTPDELQKFVSPDPAESGFFGHSVDVDQDTAVIGSPGDVNAGIGTGAAYIFVKSGGTWVQQAKLLASDGASGDYFGGYVAIDGDTVVVGAHLNDDVAMSTGSAYVFVRSGTVWTQQAQFTAFDAAIEDYFGAGVDIDGDTALIAAISDSHPGAGDAGSVYVYLRTGTLWSLQTKLIAFDTMPGDAYGVDVAIQGDTAAVTAVGDDVHAFTDAGCAYVYTRSGTVWSQQAKLTASDAATGDFFGRSIALHNDSLLVGASHEDANGTDAGAAYVFTRSGTVWTQQAKLLAFDGVAGDFFGWSAALEDDTAVVSAYYDSHGIIVDAGSAYAFTRSGGVWSTSAKYVPSDISSVDRLGRSLSMSGDVLFIGAHFDHIAGNTWAGSAYVFDVNYFNSCDLDADGDADMADTAILADVLVDADTNPLHVGRADVNCSGTVNGLDIQPYVDCFLP